MIRKSIVITTRISGLNRSKFPFLKLKFIKTPYISIILDFVETIIIILLNVQFLRNFHKSKLRVLKTIEIILLEIKKTKKFSIEKEKKCIEKCLENIKSIQDTEKYAYFKRNDFNTMKQMFQ